MPANPVILIDTSVLTNLLRVPGMCDRAGETQDAFRRLRDMEHAKFVIPVTVVIETGNFVAQCAGDRAGAAHRFCKAIEAARASSPPWTIREVTWDGQFLEALLRPGSASSGLGASARLKHRRPLASEDVTC